jgi:unconventional prefoldin RPB5 interactor 1
MAASTHSALESIEHRRAQLQESVETLRKALSHWTTWEAEYETLKEEIENGDDPSAAQLREIAQSLDSRLLDADEVEELLGKHLQTKRTANQVVDMISRRIDYVRQNSATIEKQLDAAEKQLAGVDVLLEPGMENEEGLPMMDIEEELDEAGNEVASSVNQTGKAAAEIVEILRKAGLQKADLEKQQNALQEQRNIPNGDQAVAAPGASATSVGTTAPNQPGPTPPEADTSVIALSTPEKSVADESKFEESRLPSFENGYNDDVEYMNFTSGTKVIELDQDDNELATYPIIPQGESQEDAELRRQMLQYGLSEVGSIVAELDLDHPLAEYSDDHGDSEYGDESDDEVEDEYGRSLKPAITDDYREQMLELEKKLNARMMENVGPQDGAGSLAEHASDIRTLRVHEDEQFDQSRETIAAEKQSSVPKPKSKRAVRFADDLDVSEAPRPSHAPTASSRAPDKVAPTIAETIVERSTSDTGAPEVQKKPARASKFMRDLAVRNAQPRILPNPPMPEPPSVPTGPTGRTLASTIIEHSPQRSESNAPDEFDPIVLNREIQTEYNKARNRFIQQQDGFKLTEEDVESPIVEEKDGKTKKVSRFMSARLKANGM